MNPAIAYKKERDSLSLDTKEELERYDELYKKSLKECTHKEENGESAWRELSEDLLYCPYCGLTD